MKEEKGIDWNIFINSVFFVLGFSVIFSLVGVLLQSVLSEISYSVQLWLGRIGGVVIIFFGLYLLGLIKISFLEKEHKLKVKKRFNSEYFTSFIFGAAFAAAPLFGTAFAATLLLGPTGAAALFLRRTATADEIVIFDQYIRVPD